MKPYLKVVKALKADGIYAKVEGNDFKELYWLIDDIRHFIYESDISENGESLAWLQSSDEDDHLLVMYKSGLKFTWKPKTYNPVFGCECIYIGWREDLLLFIYLEKHDIYICTILEDKVNTCNFHGEDIFVGKSVVAYSSYKDRRDGVVKVILANDLNEIETTDIEQAEKRGIKPIYYQEITQ